MAAPTILKTGFVFRGGSRKARNMTPRLEKDICETAGRAGLSAYLAMADATKPGDWCQKIDVALLTVPLAAFVESDGHVGIAPMMPDETIDIDLLTEWALSRGAESAHALTEMVLNAIIEPMQRPK